MDAKDAIDKSQDEIPAKRPKTIRPKLASSLILTRQSAKSGTEILFGRRSGKHAFMPQKYVFPGGRVDRGDGYAPLGREPRKEVIETCCKVVTPHRARAAAAAAIRETAEETGLLIAVPGACSAKKTQWQMFAEAGVSPDAEALRVIARAVTPPGRTRRFDTWFFTTDAEALQGSSEPTGNGELEDLKWVPLEDAKSLDIPIITHFVLDELNKHRSNSAPGVSSFRMDGKEAKVTIL
jgi:8-oxo-dGTP pyrophosphatase MutT (NUDIX family)